MRKINRTFFFDFVRNRRFGGELDRKQIDGMSAIRDYWEKAHASKDDRWLAYILGTA